MAERRDPGEFDFGGVFASGWGGHGDDLEVGVAGVKVVTVDGDLAYGGVLDRFAFLGVFANGAGTPELCEVGVAVDRASQQFGQSTVLGVTSARAS